jgi:hypothetical protein
MTSGAKNLMSKLLSTKTNTLKTLPIKTKQIFQSNSFNLQAPAKNASLAAGKKQIRDKDILPTTGTRKQFANDRDNSFSSYNSSMNSSIDSHETINST